jgi:hypothetical protein
MSSATYSDRELNALERVGRRRTVEALVDIWQTHLEEYLNRGDRR